MLDFHGDPLWSSPNFQTSFWRERIFHQHKHAFSKDSGEIWEHTLSAHHCKEKYPKLNK